MQPLIVPIAGGKQAIVDPDDRWVTRFSWSLNRGGYAQAKICGHMIRMHCLIYGTKPKNLLKCVIAHKNSDKLDNRRSNLELVTQGKNLLNTNDRLNRKNTSGYRGVYAITIRGKKWWRGRVTVNGKLYGTRGVATVWEAAVLLNALRKKLGIPIDPKVPLSLGEAA